MKSILQKIKNAIGKIGKRKIIAYLEKEEKKSLEQYKYNMDWHMKNCHPNFYSEGKYYFGRHRMCVDILDKIRSNDWGEE